MHEIDGGEPKQLENQHKKKLLISTDNDLAD